MVYITLYLSTTSVMEVTIIVTRCCGSPTEICKNGEEGDMVSSSTRANT